MTKIEPGQHPFGISQATDNLANRGRAFPDDGRKSQDLIPVRNLRLFQQVDDFDLIAARKMIFAQLLQISERRDRLRSRPGNVEPQCPLFLRGADRFCSRFPG